jgi:precorrin-4/cobalt-precorrin-4 C11-methyltransferase
MGKVYFIGAGPGDPELITVKGQRIISEAALILYAGSLVPEAVLEKASENARIENSASMSLAETNALLTKYAQAGNTVARVHTGDPALYGAVQEQAELLAQAGIKYEIIPGVTSACAAAAASGSSFTVPGGTQTLILTRMAGRTPVPEEESIRVLAAHKTAMAVYLSASKPEDLRAELLAGGLDPETKVVLGYRIGWPEEKSVVTTIENMAVETVKHGFNRQTVFLILPKETSSASKLYDSGFTHMFRDASENKE